MTWNEVFEIAEKVYGCAVEEDGEPFIICPECGEPIYKDDYEGEGLCPACEFDFSKEE